MTHQLLPDPQNPHEPTPQDFGFPTNPNILQLRCWAHQEAFLAEFARRGIISAACAAAEVTVMAHDWWDSQDLYAFKKRKAAAARQALGVLEVEIHRRGSEGVDKPIFWRGQKVDTVREYSDNLLMFRTKRLDPAYKDNFDPRVVVQPVQITRIIIHGVESAAVQVSTSPGLPASQVVEGQVIDEKATLPTASDADKRKEETE